MTFIGSRSLYHLMTGPISLAESRESVTTRGGVVGSLVAFPMRRLIGFWGAFLVLFAILVLGALVMTRATMRDVAATLMTGFRAVRRYFSPPKTVTMPRVQPMLEVSGPAPEAPKRGGPPKVEQTKASP